MLLAVEVVTANHLCSINWTCVESHCCCCLFFLILVVVVVPSVLWHCWLGGRKGTRPVKKDWWGASVVICLKRGADLPLPLTVSCFSKIQIGFTFMVPAHLGSPAQRAVKWMFVLFVCWKIFNISYFFSATLRGWLGRTYQKWPTRWAKIRRSLCLTARTFETCN